MRVPGLSVAVAVGLSFLSWAFLGVMFAVDRTLGTVAARRPGRKVAGE
jgi:hypothetical protein